MHKKFSKTQKAKFFNEIKDLSNLVASYINKGEIITKELVLELIDNIERPFTYSHTKWIVKDLLNVFPEHDEIIKVCDDDKSYKAWLEYEQWSYNNFMADYR